MTAMYKKCYYRTNVVGAILLCGTLLMACGRSVRGGVEDSTSATCMFLEKGVGQMDADIDSALVLLLTAADYAEGCQKPEVRYEVYRNLSVLYEQKNFHAQQQECQQRMHEVAREMGDSCKESLALQQMSALCMAMGDVDKAEEAARKAMTLIHQDSLEQKAHVMLLLCQIFLQKDEADSACCWLDEAASVYAPILSSEIGVLSQAYVAANRGDDVVLDSLIKSGLEQDNLYLNAELARLLMGRCEAEGRWMEAYNESLQLLELTDSISQMENGANMAYIHELRHRQALECSKAEKEVQRARFWLLLVAAVCLLLVACVLVLLFHRRAARAHAGELEAMRLASQAQESEAYTHEENVRLQKLYYEHLYAIILPILNARRGKAGHIDLEEDSWRLIESNTDMVLPGFTAKLRHNHPSLTTEDVRFCCLLMMRVPNAVLADVYGIAPSSVSIRKQRMKKKLDADIHEQTVENYLNKYIL